jgi:hypothetical protein
LVSRSGETPASAATFATAHHCSSADLGIEPQLASDLKEPSVELPVDADCDLPDPQLARHQVIGRRTHAAGDDQPRHQPPVMTADRQLLIECHR